MSFRRFVHQNFYLSVRSKTVETRWLRTEIPFRHQDFDGTCTWKWFVDCANFDSTGRFIKLIQHDPGISLTTIATETIPAGHNGYLEFEFTPSATALGKQVGYQIQTQGFSPAGFLDTHNFGIICEQESDGTKGSVMIPLASLPNSSISDVDASSSAVASFVNVSGVYIDSSAQGYFHYVADNWDVIDEIMFFALMDNTVPRVRMWNGTQSVQMIELTPDAAFAKLYWDEFAPSAAGWVDGDGDEFFYQARSSTGAQARVYQVGMVIRLSELNRWEHYLQMSRADSRTSGSGASVRNWGRSYISGSQQPNAIQHVATVRENSAGDVSISAVNAGSSITGTTGTKIDSSELSITETTKGVQRVTLDPSDWPEEGDHVIFQSERTSGSEEWWSAYLVYLMIRGEQTSLEEDTSWDAEVTAEVIPAEVGTIEEDASWAAAPVVQIPESGVLSEAASWAAEVTAEILDNVAVLEEDASWQAEVAAEVINLIHPYPVLLAEILMSESREWSDDWLRGPTKIAEARVLAWGSYSRSMPIVQHFMQIGDGSLLLADPDGEIRSLFASETPKRKLINLLIGHEDLRRDLFQQLHVGGQVTEVEFPGPQVRLKIMDHSLKWLDEDIPMLITSQHFSLEDETFQAFAPIVLGVMSDELLSEDGAWDCPRISDTRFCAARHLLPTGDLEVRRRKPGERRFKVVSSLSYDWEVEEITERGVTYQVQIIEFDASQDEGTEIRCSGGGMTVDGTSATASEENPAKCLKNMVLRLAGRPSTDINAIRFSQSATELDSLGYKCAGAYQEQMTWREAFTWFKRSFNLPVFPDKFGNLAVGLINPDDTNLPTFDDNTNILVDSVVQRIAMPTANRLTYRYNKLPTGEYYSELIYENELDQAILGEIEESEDLEMPLVRDAVTAAAVAADYMSYQTLSAHRFEHTSPLVPTFSQVDLAELEAIGHYGGINAPQGFEGRQHRIHELTMNLDTLDIRIKSVRRNPAVETQALLNGFWSENHIPGPWPGPAPGIFNAIMAAQFAGASLRVFDSFDWGKTWSHQLYTLSNTIVSVDTISDDNQNVHVATLESNGRIAYHRYSMQSRSFTIEDETVRSAIGSFGSPAVSIAIRSDSREIVIAGPLELDAGVYHRYAIWRRVSSSNWSVESSVFPEVDGATTKHTDLYRIHAGLQDRIHCFSALYGTGLDSEHVATLRANNTVTGPTKIYQPGSSAYYRAKHNHGRGMLYEHPDGKHHLLIPYRGSWAAPHLIDFEDKDTMDAGFRWGTHLGESVMAGSSPSGNSLYTAGTAFYLRDPADNGLKYFHLYSRGFWEVVRRGSSISTMIPTGAGEEQVGPRLSNQHPISATCHPFVQGGKLWFARLFSIHGGPTGFELVADTSLPKTSSYTQALFLLAAEAFGF